MLGFDHITSFSPAPCPDMIDRPKVFFVGKSACVLASLLCQMRQTVIYADLFSRSEIFFFFIVLFLVPYICLISVFYMAQDTGQ